MLQHNCTTSSIPTRLFPVWWSSKKIIWCPRTFQLRLKRSEFGFAHSAATTTFNWVVCSPDRRTADQCIGCQLFLQMLMMYWFCTSPLMLLIHQHKTPRKKSWRACSTYWSLGRKQREKKSMLGMKIGEMLQQTIPSEIQWQRALVLTFKPLPLCG